MWRVLRGTGGLAREWGRTVWWGLSLDPLLFLLSLLMLLVVWGVTGTAYGLANLFWHETWYVELGAGVGVALFFCTVSFLGYLFYAQEYVDDDEARTRVADKPRPPLKRHRRVMLIAVPLFLFAAAPAFVSQSGEVDIAHRLIFVAGLGVGVLVFIAAVRFADRNADLSEPFTMGTVRREAASLFRYALGVFVSLIAWSALGWSLAAGLTIGLTMSLVVAAYGVLHFYWRPWVYPVVIGLILLAGLIDSLRPDAHRLNALADDYALGQGYDPDLAPDAVGMFRPNRPALFDYDKVRAVRRDGHLLDDRDVLEKWYTSAPEWWGRPGPPPLVVVTTSGGASVSALFTVTFLAELEQRAPGSSRHIRVITGASGGMVGAAYFRTQRKHFDGASADKAKMLGESLRGRMAADFLSPVAQTWAFRDIPLGMLYPFGYARDRGHALEEIWDRALTDNPQGSDIPPKGAESPAMAANFRRLRDEEARGAEPSLIFSPMLVEDGRPLLISTLDLDPLIQVPATRRLSEPQAILAPAAAQYRPAEATQPDAELRSVRAVEFFKMFPGSFDTLSLGTAARMSASFPYVSPAAVLPTVPPRRVVDAGYYDNHGISVAASWLQHHAEDLRRWQVPIVVIQLRPYAVIEHDRPVGGAPSPPVTAEELRKIRDPESGDRIKVERDWKDGVGLRYQELTTPIEGAYAGMRSSMVFRNESELRLLQNLFDANQLSSFTFVGNLDVSLNWYLPRTKVAEVVDRVRLAADGDALKTLGPIDFDTEAAVRWNAEQFRLLDRRLKR